MTPDQGEALLNVYEQCRDVTGAFNQYRQRGRDCRPEYVEAIKKLAREVKEAKAKGVPESLTTKLLIDHLPTKVLKLLG